MRKIRWTKAEIAILEAHYPAGGDKGCKPYLPGRSLISIRLKAFRLGLSVYQPRPALLTDTIRIIINIPE